MQSSPKAAVCAPELDLPIPPHPPGVNLDDLRSSGKSVEDKSFEDQTAGVVAFNAGNDGRQGINALEVKRAFVAITTFDSACHSA
ncbi:hypothetical protein HDU81_010625 [Chytriomyces hyalinus]|nr:hypothetical protein HDU81_010625 [Chytriomyces hyalinus]